MVSSYVNLSDYFGLFMYTCFQSLAMAAVGAYFLYSLYKKGFSNAMIILSLAYFGLFNIIPLYLVSLWKDTPFAIIVFLFSTFLFNIFWNKNSEKKLFDCYHIFIYCILSYLLAFARNNGFYVFVLFSVVLVIYFAHQGAAVGILDQIRPGGTLHVQHGAEKESDRDLHQVRP